MRWATTFSTSITASRSPCWYSVAASARHPPATSWAPLRYLATVPTDLGYKAQVHIVDRDDVFSYLGDPRNHFQIDLTLGWVADYPRPYTFFYDLFACPTGISSSNRGAYCNPQIDRLIATAEAKESTDLIAANALWAQIERQLVDDAPNVPTIDIVDPYLTSPRLGNAQESPLFFVPFDQMWVK
jgi:ABC-type oligopeptide transport system substrate-binding subunit